MNGYSEKKTNPWLGVPLDEYEIHMASPDVGQLPALRDLFLQAYREVFPQRLLVLGCEAGNGFEHVEPDRTRLLVGADLNLSFLSTATKRHKHGNNPQLICMDLSRPGFSTNSFDHIHAALIFEYVNPVQLLQNIESWLVPGGTLSVVLQLPSPIQGTVSSTPFESLKALGEILHLVNPEEFTSITQSFGFIPGQSEILPLPGGKAFYFRYYNKPEK
ncbi:MAG TPA: class I SAM-dependent methyltransferase [Thermoanaerobaculia bacterium]|nr:class I SAM-dependent methyltransferase [Thermoanaerobaculia bacterium]HUM31067.1 class I SAM-dependent methyltransferase [Thermoanaerobaculia bacterium]HXK69421.1 class I SAM-dependent methyltransferase [Thermoanaerobaculia bacterium]